MIVDAESLNLVNAIGCSKTRRGPDQARADGVGARTLPCANAGEAGEQPRRVRERAARRAAESVRPARTRSRCGTTSGSPPARATVSLRFVARQELIFGMHVHVGDGMRVHLAVLLALSANSPFCPAAATGLMLDRMPIFRQFPRVRRGPTTATGTTTRASSSS